MKIAAPRSRGRRDAANSGKPDAGGRAAQRGFITAQSGNVAHFPTCNRSGYVPTRCPLSVLAASGDMETGAPDGELLAIAARQTAFTAPGASVPGQFEEVI